jgi:hypothetical protein
MEAATRWIEARKEELKKHALIRGYRFSKSGPVKKRDLMFFHINYDIEAMKTAYRKKGINASNTNRNRKEYKKIGKTIKTISNRILEVETASEKFRMSSLKNLVALLNQGSDDFMAAEEKCIRTFDITSFVRNKKAEAARRRLLDFLRRMLRWKKMRLLKLRTPKPNAYLIRKSCDISSSQYPTTLGDLKGNIWTLWKIDAK